jgi:hypothetical protein
MNSCPLSIGERARVREISASHISIQQRLTSNFKQKAQVSDYRLSDRGYCSRSWVLYLERFDGAFQASR